jgi:multiple sugar transport system permease protein
VTVSSSAAVRQAHARSWALALRPSTPTLFVLPCMVLILAVTIFPSVWALVLSFFRWDLQSPEHPFVGLANYITALSDPITLSSVRFTLMMAVVLITIDIAIGMSLALIISRGLAGQQIFTSIFLLPVMVSPVVAGYSWRILFDTRLGPINHVISLLRGAPTFIPWLNDITLSTVAIIIVNIWQSTPFMFLTILAGLSAVDPEYYEAGALDGANPWQTFWHITIPLIRPVLLVAVLFHAIGVFNMFGEVFVITKGGPGTATQTIAYHIYQTGFLDFRWGYTSAASFMFLGFTVALASIVLRRIRET